MTRPLELGDVEASLLECADDKAPGIDGFPIGTIKRV